MSKIMNNTNVKISKENREDEEGGIAMLRRLTKLSILPKFRRLDIQVGIKKSLLSAVIFEMGSAMKINLTPFDFLRGREFSIRKILAPRLLQSLVVSCLLLVILVPLVSNAAVNIVPCGKGTTPETTAAGTNRPCTFDDLVSLGQNITNFLLKDVAVPFAVILFMWAGFMLMFKSSSAGSMQEAKDIFWNVVVGFVIALAAVLIVKFILFGLGAKEELYKNRLTFNVVELKK